MGGRGYLQREGVMGGVVGVGDSELGLGPAFMSSMRLAVSAWAVPQETSGSKNCTADLYSP